MALRRSLLRLRPQVRLSVQFIFLIPGEPIESNCPDWRDPRIGAKAGTSRFTNPDRDALGYLLNPDPCVAIDGRAVGMTLISILPWRFPSFTASLPQIYSSPQGRPFPLRTIPQT